MKTQVYIQLSNNYIEPDSEETWIEWYCKKRGHEFLCEVDWAYIEDSSNLLDLESKFESFQKVLNLIIDYQSHSLSDNENDWKLAELKYKLLFNEKI